MGYGNIDNTLALAEAVLGDDATPTQIKKVLNGGTVNNVTFEGILDMRASGMGWGVIAQELGSSSATSSAPTRRTPMRQAFNLWPRWNEPAGPKGRNGPSSRSVRRSLSGLAREE